jgi:hypothetical protein
MMRQVRGLVVAAARRQATTAAGQPCNIRSHTHLHKYLLACAKLSTYAPSIASYNMQLVHADICLSRRNERLDL